MDHAEEITRRLVDLTRDLVLIPGTEKRPVERARCFQLLTQHLEQVPGVAIRRFERGGFESMVVAPEGVEEPEVLMVVHLDVIEHGDSFDRSFVRQAEDGEIGIVQRRTAAGRIRPPPLPTGWEPAPGSGSKRTRLRQ